jgi:putative NADH-flavin reductase
MENYDHPCMRLFVLGATGKTGGALVDQALKRGHAVTAFCRSPFGGDTAGALKRITGNPMNARDLAAALPGHDAVLSVLGSRSLGKWSVRVDAARATIDAMRRGGVRRLIIVSSALLDEHIGWFPRFLAKTLLRHHASDQRAMEEVVTSSDLDWTVLRPPMLNGAPLTGRYAATTIAPSDAGGMKMSREDVAHMMLDEAETRAHRKQIVWLRGAPVIPGSEAG